MQNSKTMQLNDNYIHSKPKISYKPFNKTLKTLNVGDVLQTFITLSYYFLCYLYLLNIMIYRRQNKGELYENEVKCDSRIT